MGSKNRPKGETLTGETRSSSTPALGEKRELPDDPAEWEKTLLPYRVMASPWVIASSKALGHFPPKAPLDAKESAGLETGIAAVMYQEGLKMNAWFLLGSAVLGIGAVRLAMYIDQKELRAQQGTKTLSAAETQAAVKTEREKPATLVRAPEPINGTPPARVATVPSAAEAAPVHKELTAEQAAAIVHFPGEN